MADPKYAWQVALLGDPDLLTADEVGRLMDHLCGRYFESHRVELLVTGVPVRVFRERPRLPPPTRRWCYDVDEL